MDRQLRIVYMGTPEFAVEPLETILNANFRVDAVVTVPDKPAGRGQKILFSPVKEFALSRKIPVFQPVSLKSQTFLNELRNVGANLQVVVAFRMLPEVVWKMPEFGTLNLHASMLPQYRGAAPINHAIMNGETETGVTTFFIDKEIDTGSIIMAEPEPIFSTDDAGMLHDRLKHRGSQLLVKTLRYIESGQVQEIKQKSLIADENLLKKAPKIFPGDCLINWNTNCHKIFNFIRGLSPYPAAFSMIELNGELKKIKIYRTSFSQQVVDQQPGSILTDGRKNLLVVSVDGIIRIEELQVEGKKRMGVVDFLNGTTIPQGCKFRMQ
jgi:methionyl-tRNA formyltransferase